MSKPQLASEPSMEEILSSIRKMISDDRPGPSPMPDQWVGRTSAEPAPQFVSPASANAGAQQGGGHSSNFNSLADALKVATALSDQRRSIQQEIASVLDKGPRRTEPLSEGVWRPAPIVRPRRMRPRARIATARACPIFPTGAMRQPPASPMASVS